MRTRWLLNLLLLCCVIALGVFIMHAKDKPEGVQPLTHIDKATIDQIEITHRDRVVRLAKIAAHWQMQAPVAIAANDFRIDNLLGLLATPAGSGYAAASLQLADYGLATPLTRIRFNQHVMAFGNSGVVNQQRYVLYQDKVFLIGEQFYALIASQLGTLVAPNLLPHDARINRLVLPEQTLEKTATGWRSSRHDVSTDAIVETITHWQRAQAFGVHDYFERKALGSIEVSMENQPSPLLFTITDTDPWLIIARPEIGLEYHFNLESYDALLRPGASGVLPEEFNQDSPPLPAH
jgi:hypothetical protein